LFKRLLLSLRNSFAIVETYWINKNIIIVWRASGKTLLEKAAIIAPSQLGSFE
jgi:hypothetical protein